MAEITDGHGDPLNENVGADNTFYAGWQIQMKVEAKLIKVTKRASGVAATKAYLYQDGAGASAIEVATFSGAVATFSGTTTLSNGVQYWIVIGSDGSTYNNYIKAAATGWPYSGTNLDIGTDEHAVGVDDIDNSSVPMGGGSDHIWGIISITTEEVVAGTNMQINITDAWKEVDAMQINIGDAWKPVAGAQVNIGDVWKTIF